MQEQAGGDRAVGSVRVWECAVAAVFFAFGAVVSWDSHRIGSSWGDDGPQAGYFPFYIGVLIMASSIATLYEALRMDPAEARKPFVMRGQLKLVLTVLIPSVFYVALIDNPWTSLGIYVPSALLIAACMKVLGKYGWLATIGVSVGVMVAFFVMFEIWFQVPLPKGPLESALGFG
jgi:hypothetical protein